MQRKKSINSECVKKNESDSAYGKSRFGVWNARFVYRYAAWILAFIAFLCVLAVPFAKNLKLHANFLELLPASSQSVKNLKELTSHVGGTSFLICVVESPDEKTAKIAADRFGEKANQFEGIDYVDNRTSVPVFENRKLLFLKLSSVEKLKKDILNLLGYYRRQANPFMLDLVKEKAPEIDVSALETEQKVYRIGGFAHKDQNSFMRVILIKPSHTVGDFSKSRKLFETAQSAFNASIQGLEHPATMGMTGPYCTRESEYRTITRDLRWTGTLTTILISLIMLFAFRSVRYLLYAYIPLGASILLTWAFTQMTIGYLNLITAFLVSILLGMGSDYTLHMLVNLEPDLKAKKDIYKALETTYCELWLPLLSSMLTTAVAFGAMTISGFEGFRHFGIIAGAGITIAFVVVFYGLPSLVVIGEKFFPSREKVRKEKQPINKHVVNIILISGVLFTVFSVVQIPKIHFNYDFTALQSSKDDTLELAERIGHYFGVQLNPVALITPNRQRAAEVTDQVNKYISKRKDTSFDFASSLVTHVPQQQFEKIKVFGEIDALLEQRKNIIAKLDKPERDKIDELRVQLKATPLTLNDLPDGIKRQYEGDHQEISIVFVYPNASILDGKVTQRFVKELRGLQLGSDVKVAGEAVIFADVLNQMEKDTPIVMFLSFATVIGLLFLHFRRLNHVLWVLAPVLVGGLWTVGMSGMTGLAYNFINLTILPSIVGVGIDSGIYIFDHYREKKNENFFVSMQKTSKGVILSASTNIAAFVSLAFAQHQGMASMGLLGVFGFLSCLLAAVYFVPSVIEFFEFRTKHLFRRNN